MLLSCLECGGDLSSTARFCPHCGYRGDDYERPDPRPEPMALWKWGLVLMVWGGIAYAVVHFLRHGTILPWH